MARTYRALPMGTIAGFLTAAQLCVAAPAHATCPEGQQEDPTTRMCWSQDAQGSSFSSGGFSSGTNPCLPGRLGNCVGQLLPNALQNPGPQIKAGPPDPATAGANAWLPSKRN